MVGGWKNQKIQERVKMGRTGIFLFCGIHYDAYYIQMAQVKLKINLKKGLRCTFLLLAVVVCCLFGWALRHEGALDQLSQYFYSFASLFFFILHNNNCLNCSSNHDESYTL